MASRIMPRPFTPLQAHQNQLFLDSLGRTGNARLSARVAGVHYGTIQHRRSDHADFAQRWAATVAAVDARLHLAGGKRGPSFDKLRMSGSFDGLRMSGAEALRTKGGEAMVVRTRSGRLQIRLAHPNKLTHAAEQAFLYALSATANIRLSAAAAGASPAAFYRRRRLNPVFAREMRLALKMGWERLEMTALAAANPANHGPDHWRTCAEAPMPPLSWDQAFQLLCLHEKSVRQSWDQPHRRRRRGESEEVHRERLRAMWAAEKRIEAEDEALRRAACYEASGGWRHEDEPPPPELPPLEQVTGWSKASGRAGRHGGLALFGGWRIEAMTRKLAKG
jgi:hypothetical protein